jgi:hypothetical protein
MIFNYLAEKYSAIGPKVKAGKKDKAATNKITAKPLIRRWMYRF